MKITLENFRKFVPVEEQNLVEALFHDLEELNQELENRGEDSKKLSFDIEMEHTEYSPERTDPCPDYYGCYSIYFDDSEYEKVGDYMTVDDLDNAMFILVSFIKR